ncbi:MAG: EFR1 family ferrodoxin [Ruminiclostridium sp.]
MSTTIFYFFGTGNSLAVAKDLERELQEAVELVPITKLTKEKEISIDSDVMGIVFPVYLHDIPRIVEEFTKKLILKDPYVFAICTYNKEPSNALFNLNSKLSQNGKQLNAGFRIIMPGNSVIAMDLTTSDEENQRRFIKEKKKIKQIAEVIKKRSNILIEGQFDKDENYDSKNYIDYIYKVAEKFWTNDKCNLCDMCTKLCPKNSIEIVNDKVVWKDNCEKCLACLHWCLQAAIENGDISPMCRRYHHPEISIMDIINQSK